VTVHEPRTAMASAWTLVERLLRGRNVVHLQARSNQRSRVDHRVLVLHCEWPFGFFAAETVVRCAAELVTEPGRLRLPAPVLESLRQPAVADRDSRLQTGPDFHSLREHHPDEDARAVHALRSAALGLLVRREMRGSMLAEVGIVLDLRRPPGRNPRLGQRRFEWSLSACASMLDLLCGQGTAVRVVVLGAESRSVLVQSAAEHTALLTFLSEAEPVPHVPLEEATLRELAACERSYWIAAGGHLEQGELQLPSGNALLVAEER
jgi:uncharacterized protein (DUF58 family)